MGTQKTGDAGNCGRLKPVTGGGWRLGALGTGSLKVGKAVIAYIGKWGCCRLGCSYWDAANRGCWNLGTLKSGGAATGDAETGDTASGDVETGDAETGDVGSRDVVAGDAEISGRRKWGRWYRGH